MATGYPRTHRQVESSDSIVGVVPHDHRIRGRDQATSPTAEAPFPMTKRSAPSRPGVASASRTYVFVIQGDRRFAPEVRAWSTR